MSRGKLCAKCSIGYNREWRDPQARLTRPLRRVGPKGEGSFRARLVGRGPGGYRRPLQADCCDQRGADHYQHPLHRHDLAPRLLLPAALLPPPRCHRGRSPTRSATWPATSRSPMSTGPPWMASTRARRATQRASWCGGQSLGFGAARPRALAPRGARQRSWSTRSAPDGAGR